MSTTVAVLLIGVVTSLMFVVVSVIRGRGGRPDEPMDASDVEHWLVAVVVRHERVAAMLRGADRRVIGGVAVAAAFTLVFTSALVVGAVLDSVDSGRGFARWDDAVAAWGPAHADSVTVDVLRWITELGGTVWLVAAMTVIGVVEWIRRRNLAPLGFLLAVGLGVSAVNNGLKYVIMRERPPVEHLVESAGSSFPSGHSAAAAACWLAMALIAKRWVRPDRRTFLTAGAVGLACLVAASRALLGVHWLTDVIAGVVVGWTWCFLVAIVFGGRILRFGQPVDDIATATAGRSQDRRSVAEHNGARVGARVARSSAAGDDSASVEPRNRRDPTCERRAIGRVSERPTTVRRPRGGC